MAKAKRVFQIAKDLGVDSKAVVAKCQAEGLDIKNHMSTVSLGLEMTIRDWFSEAHDSGGGTAVETSKEVDLGKVRKAKARKKAKPAEPAAETPPEAEQPPAAQPTEAQAPEAPAQAPAEPPTAEAEAEVEAEAPIEAPAAPEAEAESAPEVESAGTEAGPKKAKARRRERPAAAEAAEAPEAPEAPAELEPGGSAPDAGAPEAPTEEAGEPQAPTLPDVAEPPAEPQTLEPAAEAPAEAPTAETESPAETDEADKPRAVPNVPRRPEVIKPAGPQLTRPQTAELKGPKVVRVERPDVVQPPRPRRPAADKTEPEPIRSRGPERGKGAGAPKPEEESARSPRRKRGGGGASGGREKDTAGRRRAGFSQQDLLEREERLSRAGGYLKQRRRDMKKRAQHGGGAQAQTAAAIGGKVEIAEPFTIKELSAATGLKAADIIGYLFRKGVMTTVNHMIDAELAQEVCLEYNIELEVKEAKTAQQAVESELEQREAVDTRRRPPVVAVLGHVDHGKTSLLDRIREADVVSGESGGITQHIGAYRATIRGTDGQDKTVVFLDTPGHEAFTAMRSRGANLTDVVVLVVAADDGVMPQTAESISHAKAAGVSIVVALNKIDKPEATDSNVQRILGQLAEHGLNPVEWGGETEIIRTSAETGEGVTDLMEILDYQAELLELTADYGGRAYGQVIEAELSEGRGPVGRILVRGGQLRVSDFIVMGRAYGRVRDMLDDRGNAVEVAGPATPVEISGIDEVPDAGDKFYVTETLKQAEEIATTRREDERRRELAAKSRVSLDNVFEQMAAGETKELRVVIKADVQGSVEVLRKTMEEISDSSEEVSVRVLHAAVGGITESDVLLAEASDAVIIGFQVIASPHARASAEQRGVDVRLYRVIYDIIEDVRNAMEGMLAPEHRENVLGHAEVREVFRVTRVGAVAGCYVTDGVVRRNALIRVTRNEIVVEHDRVLSSLKRFKDDVREVRQGTECGMSIEGYDDIQVGDVLECYEMTQVKPSLS